MPNYGKFLKELISNTHKLEHLSAAFLSDESFAMIQNKVPPKLGYPGSFLIPCNFNKAFSCNALADLDASINLMPYSLYAKLSLETLKPIKMSVILANISFQYPIGIAKNMLVEVGKFTFPIDFVILEMEEDNKVPFFLGRPFLHTADEELISNTHKLEHLSAAFLSDESFAMIQNKVPPKLGYPGSFLIPCNFNKAFSCNALADLDASINLMPYSLYAKLSLETLKPIKMSVILANISFQYPIGIAKNMLVEVGKFTFPIDFVILEMEEDNKVPFFLGRPFLHTADEVIQVK
nr:reverse transcriptase domain-containing protein [Tanacetum cinerariifolium]